MKQTTFDKYTQFLRLLNAKNVYDLGFQQRKYKIADAFVSFLFKNNYLQRKVGGSVKLIDCPLGFNHIVNAYKKATEKKPNTMVNNSDNLIQNVGGEIHFSRPATMSEREQLSIDILDTIMRDNQHITYDLIRIERKVIETKTDLLKR